MPGLGGPAAAKAPAGAGEESGRLDAGTGRNWHWAHGPACGDAVVRGCPVSGEVGAGETSSLEGREGLGARTPGSEGGGGAGG